MSKCLLFENVSNILMRFSYKSQYFKLRTIAMALCRRRRFSGHAARCCSIKDRLITVQSLHLWDSIGWCRFGNVFKKT